MGLFNGPAIPGTPVRQERSRVGWVYNVFVAVVFVAAVKQNLLLDLMHRQELTSISQDSWSPSRELSLHGNTSSHIERLPVLMKPRPLPPLEEVELAMRQGNHTAGQFMLDVAIVGHAKCGSTTLKSWLGQHPEMSVVRKEVTTLQTKPAWSLVTKLYTDTNVTVSDLIRAYKSPLDINDEVAVTKLKLFFPRTKLIVGLRHPVWMFESFYNFRIQNGWKMLPLDKLPYRDEEGDNVLDMTRAMYHVSLANLHKTNATKNLAEQALFPKWKVDSWSEPHRSYRMESPNPVFLYDTAQLEGDNTKTIMVDLQNFLGLTRPLSEPLHISPGKKLPTAEQVERDSKKVNICDHRYRELRVELVRIGSLAQRWILKYLLQSPTVYVSSRRQFASILLGYARDPCQDRIRQVMSNATSSAA